MSRVKGKKKTVSLLNDILFKRLKLWKSFTSDLILTIYGPLSYWEEGRRKVSFVTFVKGIKDDSKCTEVLGSDIGIRQSVMDNYSLPYVIFVSVVKPT